MPSRTCLRGSAALIVAGLLISPVGPVNGGAASKGLIVIDAAGKEIPLTSYTFLAGVRRLPWAKNEEHLQFREEKSTLFRDGIVTLIPLSSISQLDYDPEKKTVTAKVRTANQDAVLTASTRFVGINKIELQAEANLAGLGSASVKFRGGEPTGIRGLRFPAPRPIPAVNGAATKIIAADKEKTAHEVTDLTAVYQTGKTSALVPTLMFKKTVKIDLSKIRSLRHIPADNPKQVSSDFEVLLDGDEKHVLTLLTDTNPSDGKPAPFVGLLGRVPTGYKLFPAHTIAELHAAKQ